ncbi:yippee-domain-containing protein [Hypoxylon trugodes]|uniref:yippee-domain-containing protein n=1 Tax=Hypoxylon trugodes TaxID=326681 RepID=UPI002191AFDF|nr:yippee-domain-containing protein [Hypoxylon trugodes]KAI1389518.1 yippee-domain-containing protein [Hypoxylon trugodes]
MYSIMFSEALPAPPPPPPAQEETQGPRFPIYLLPSLTMPFRRRRRSSHVNNEVPPSDTLPSLSSSPTDSTPSSPMTSPSTPTLSPMNFLSNFKSKDDHIRSPAEDLKTTKLARTQPNTIRCYTCASDFAFTSQIVSKGFTGRYGRAFLVSPPEQPPQRGAKTRDLINIKVGKSETRVLVTGSHVVADITCAVCHAKVGWKYIDAKEESQKYKVGKFILETQRCIVYRNWEDIAVHEMPEFEMKQKDPPTTNNGEPIIFDSDDEDECEDLFMGSWDPDVVVKRRSKKVNRRQKKNAA